MDQKDSDFINAHLRKFAENIGVPSSILDRPNGSAKWEGHFNGIVGANTAPMILRPMAIEIQSNPPIGLFCIGDKTLTTELGAVFHASYSSPSLEGEFQLFRFKDSNKRGNMGEYVFTHITKDGNKNKVVVDINFCEI
jgi:hypothetical protein